MTNTPLSTMTAALRHLMATQDSAGDFVFPTILKEVPSLTLPYSEYRGEFSEDGQLAGNSAGDKFAPRPGA